MTLTAVLTFLLGPVAWLVKFFLLSGWSLVKTILWLLSPVWLMAAIAGAISGCLTTPAKAGWFDGWWGADHAVEAKVEAANQALQRAAQIATEAAQTQASQQGQLLAAVEALSNERTQLAGHLQTIGTLAARDSAWAAALQTAGPVLIAVAVLAVGCAAIWMLTRAADHDADLATVLVEEIAGTGTGVLVRHQHHEGLTAGEGGHARGLEYAPADTTLEEQEMPF
jgi:hypothetical protein